MDVSILAVCIEQQMQQQLSTSNVKSIVRVWKRWLSNFMGKEVEKHQV